ncbi:unnamed protein product [Pseudo-nitzschia multistriata]|uniref:RNA polymerase sigma-70 region 2 domain-containing protein n=1 Tax=Pseudo-nitzschia multistriata TaxID=183589 RepID=A0A448ZH97_9STRA|nr:unnamed protein product [Pseudo-nitzschia multistriata]
MSSYTKLHGTTLSHMAVNCSRHSLTARYATRSTSGKTATLAVGLKRCRTSREHRSSVHLHSSSRTISLAALLLAVTTVAFMPGSVCDCVVAFHLPHPVLHPKDEIGNSPRPWNAGTNSCYMFLSRRSNRLVKLHSTRSPPRKAASPPSASSRRVVVEAIQPMKPESSVSQQKRDAVLRDAEFSSASRSVDSALEGIDAQVLELLSEDFLYPSVGEDAKPPRRRHGSKPYGRPELVPGAMTWASMKKYQQKRDLLNHMVEKTNEPRAATLIKRNLESRLHVSSKEVSRKVQSRKQRKFERATRGAFRKTKKDKLPDEITSTQSTTEDSSLTTATKKKATRKNRVKKNLPKGRKPKKKSSDELYFEHDSQDFIGSRARPGRKRQPGANNAGDNNLELRKYYATELLTPEQEYTIGEKIQLMVQCEQVHEGLCIKEMRLPSIAEWAHACGYQEGNALQDPHVGAAGNHKQSSDHVVTELVERQIRPAGYANIFTKIDPNMFVGNGLAQNVGVGRGRGRAKKPPPCSITKNVYKLDRKTGKKLGGLSAKPVNRGTVEDFCEMMIGGRRAKQLMIQSNMRLVISIAKKYSKVGVSLQDLVQEGSLGLSRAAEKFDPSKGFKFSTYASWVRKVRSSLQQGMGRPPTDEEMADALDMPPSKYKRMIKLTKRSISLETPQYQQNPKDHGHEGDDSIGDMISSQNDFDNNLDNENVSPEKSVDRSLFHKDLDEMLDNLNEGERTVIKLRYGLEDGLTRTVTATAAKLKKPPAWVRSQESKGLRRLRRPWYEKKLMEHQQSMMNL